MSGSDIDGLPESSRNFYESTKVKAVASIALGAYCLLMLGWSCQSGGMTSYYNDYLQSNLVQNINSKTYNAAYNGIAAGCGFACFFYFLAFVFSMAASIYISPWISGTTMEKIMLRKPQDIYSIEV